jgi:hypothetical protein
MILERVIALEILKILPKNLNLMIYLLQRDGTNWNVISQL